MASPKRAEQPYSCSHHPIWNERIITAVICLLLIGTGFYTSPWLNFIDQDATAIKEQFTRHGAQSPLNISISKGKPIQPSEAGTKE